MRLGDFARGILLALLILPAWAEPPAIDHLFPNGFAPGSTNAVTVAGKFEPWPPQVWADGSGLTFRAETNKGKFQVEVAADAPAGPRLLRFYNDEGASAPLFAMIAEGREALEAEPNDQFSKAPEAGSLPVTFNGHLNKSGDVDSYAVALEAGQWLDARVAAYTFAAKMDALLRVVTPDGGQLAWNHDFGTLDPRVLWPAPSNGQFIVQVMGFKYPADAEVRLTGGAGCIYRLRLDVSAKAPRILPEGEGEAEPNNTFAQAGVAALPAAFTGAIEADGDEDGFRFEAKQGEHFEMRVEAASFGSALDAWLKITDAHGKELARGDDADQSRDPRLEWKAPTNGVYAAVIGSLFHQGGAAHYYRLTLRRAPPDYQATFPGPALVLKAGETNELKLSVKRLRSFEHKLEATIKGLPDDVVSAPVEIAAKAGEATFKLVAKPAAKSFNGPIQIEVTDAETSERRPATTPLTASSENNGVPGGYTKLVLDATPHLWLTVRPKPPEKAN